MFIIVVTNKHDFDFKIVVEHFAKRNYFEIRNWKIKRERKLIESQIENFAYTHRNCRTRIRFDRDCDNYQRLTYHVVIIVVIIVFHVDFDCHNH